MIEKIGSYVCPQRGFKNEASFTTRLGKQVRNDGGFWHKISDESRDLKPFDVIAALGGSTFGIECKFVRAMSCHPYKLLRGSSYKKPGAQVEGLTLFGKNGGKSLVIVYSAINNTYKVLKFGELSLDTKIVF